MAVDPAAMPQDVRGPKFSIITKELSGGPDANGRRRFRATASSTIVDRAGDEIELSALQQMAEQFRKGITIFIDHDFKHVESAFGLTDGAEIIQRSVDDKGQPVWDLDITGVVNTPNPRAVQLADSIDGGYAKFGASVTAFVRRHARKPNGAMKISGLEAIEASIVGVPENQRSWAQQAAVAVKSFGYKPDLEGDDMDAAETEEEAPVVSKRTLTADARDNLSDSDFACPDKKKYLIHDAAHVRAALSRIADPSNDQCGRDKIIAAARRMGIGEHAQKQLDTDEALLKWAATEFPVADITTQDGQEVFLISKELDKNKEPDKTAVSADHDTGDQPTDDGAVDESTPGGQESGQASVSTETPDAETPETASDDESTADDADPPVTEKAYSVDEVRELVGHVKGLVTEIGRLREELIEKDAKIATYEAQAGALSTEVDEAKEVIKKVMDMPLRPRTAGYVEDFKAAHSLFDPEIADYLTKRSKLSNAQ